MVAKLFDSQEDEYGNGSKSFCVGDVHVYFQMASPDGSRHSNTLSYGWEVIGPCDGSCHMFAELEGPVAELISRFKETGQPQKLIGGPWPEIF